MSETKSDYEVGRGKPPVHSRFKKGQSGNPRGPPEKLAGAAVDVLNEDVLNEKVVATIDGERREITERETVVTQLVNKSTGAVAKGNACRVKRFPGYSPGSASPRACTRRPSAVTGIQVRASSPRRRRRRATARW